MPPASRRKAVKVGLLFLLGIVVYAFVSLVLQGQQVQLTSPAAASAPAPTPSKAPDEKFVDHTGASDPRATVCLTMGYHSRIGGTEDWCRSFVKLFHNHPQYRIHMVAAYTFHASALQWYLERGILFSREPTQFGKQCDIILATGTLLPEVLLCGRGCTVHCMQVCMGEEREEESMQEKGVTELDESYQEGFGEYGPPKSGAFLGPCMQCFEWLVILEWFWCSNPDNGRCTHAVRKHPL